MPIDAALVLAVKTAAAFFASAFAFSPPIAACGNQTEFALGNADNRVTLRAGVDAPRVMCLENVGGASWQGDIDETPIPSALIDGIDTPLRWRFDAKASRAQANSATLVYTSTNPSLTLR